LYPYPRFAFGTTGKFAPQAIKENRKIGKETEFKNSVDEHFVRVLFEMRTRQEIIPTFAITSPFSRLPTINLLLWL
jgi:hypothetical protein